MKCLRRRAFTLVEIMIVVLIIGILLAIAVPNWITARESSRQKTCLSNLTAINYAKEEWATEEGKSDSSTPTPSDLVPGYLKSFPECPTSGKYTIGKVDENATCTITSGAFPHVLPELN